MEDVQYRRLVIAEEQTSIVFQHSRQRVGGPVCRKTNEELRIVLLAVGGLVIRWRIENVKSIKNGFNQPAPQDNHILLENETLLLFIMRF